MGRLFAPPFGRAKVWLFGFFVGGVLSADFTIFVQFHPIRRINGIFPTTINPLLAFFAHQFNNWAFVFTTDFFLYCHGIGFNLYDSGRVC